MNEIHKIQLKFSSIMNVPLQTYNNDFLFIVNDQEFKTSRFVSDILSPTISKIHLNDASMDQFIINTKHTGDFQLILNLVNFQEINIPDSDIEFVMEVIEFLGSESFKLPEFKVTGQLTLDNVFSLIKKQQKMPKFYTSQIESEIDFISSHFYEMNETHIEELNELNETTIFEIISNKKLKLKNEDQLLHFVNRLYQNDAKFSVFYEKVIFLNASSKAIQEFLSIFNINDISYNIWSSISSRLESELKTNFDSIKNKRYKSDASNDDNQPSIVTIEYKNGSEFEGIFANLRKIAGGNPHDKGLVKVTSKYYHSCQSCYPKNLLDFNSDNEYISEDTNPDAWICFDFNKRGVDISKYSIQSSTTDDSNRGQIKNWVIEVSNDGKNWIKIDEHSNYSGLNGRGAVQTFDVKNLNKFFRYCRLRHTGDYWGMRKYCLAINSIEFYGRLKNS